MLPAADFDALLVRPSLNVFDAALAAGLEVCFFGAFRWESALPAEAFDVFPVDLLRNVFDALLAAPFPVTFLLLIIRIPSGFPSIGLMYELTNIQYLITCQPLEVRK